MLDPGAAPVTPETLGLARGLTLDGSRRIYLLVGERAAIAAAGPQIAAGHGWLSPAPAWMPQKLEDFEPAAGMQLASLDALAQQHRERMQRVAIDTRLRRRWRTWGGWTGLCAMCANCAPPRCSH